MMARGGWARRRASGLSHEPIVTVWTAWFGLAMVLWFAGGLRAGASQKQAQLVSRPGQYQGYCRAVFDGWQRTSQYVTVRDGTRIAIDIFRPTKGGLPAGLAPSHFRAAVHVLGLALPPPRRAGREGPACRAGGIGLRPAADGQTFPGRPPDPYCHRLRGQGQLPNAPAPAGTDHRGTAERIVPLPCGPAARALIAAHPWMQTPEGCGIIGP
jgi:hypothetical protein